MTAERKDGNGLQYQDVESLQFIQVPQGEPALFDVEENPSGVDRSFLEFVVLSRFWWLNKEWQDKGLPKEQIVISSSIDDRTIQVFNFGEGLNDQHIADLKEAYVFYARVAGGQILDSVQYILIDNEQKKNTNSGDELNGGYKRGGGYIQLFPNSLRPIPHRIPSVSNLLGTLIHEGSHPLAYGLQEEWKKRFNWHSLSHPKLLPGGARVYEETSSPERCVTSYAQTKALEDICDSMVAAVRQPDLLDREKYELLRDRFHFGSLNQTPLSSTSIRLVGDSITLPRLPQVVRYSATKT